MDFEGPQLKKRKHGGIWQRQKAFAEQNQVDSALYALIMTLFAQGIMSGAQAHAIACAAQSDIDKAAQGYQVTKLQNISKLKHSKNLGPSLTRMMAKESDLPEPLEVAIPMAGASPDVPSSTVLLPHELFASFFRRGESWAESILPDPDQIGQFWANFKHHPAMEAHPIKQESDWETTAIPLGLHGDECPVLGTGKIWCKSVLSFSWFSMLACAAGQSFQRANIYIWGVFEKFCLDDPEDGSLSTMETFWRLMRWSFDILMSGKWPYTDWRGLAFPPGSLQAARAGSYLAGGFRGVLVQVAGDLDFFAKWLETPRATSHEKPCVLCKCSFSGPLWTIVPTVAGSKTC